MPLTIYIYIRIFIDWIFITKVITNKNKSIEKNIKMLVISLKNNIYEITFMRNWKKYKSIYIIHNIKVKYLLL